MKSRGLCLVAQGLCLLTIAFSLPGIVFADQGKSIFSFKVLETQELSGRFSTVRNGRITVDWGDGTRETFSGNRQAYSHDYGQPAGATVTVYAENDSVLTEFVMTQARANISFDLEDLPPGIQNVEAGGVNTITGELKNLPENLRRLHISGRNTIRGDVGDLPAGLSHFHFHGLGRITGDLQNLPAGLTYFRCYGENSITGDVKNLPAGLEDLLCYGANTITGDVGDFPAGLRNLYITGRNSLNGNIRDFPAGMRVLLCTGQNIITGDLKDLPAGITYFRLSSRRPVSYTEGRNWQEGMRFVQMDSTREHGLSARELDSLLKDLSRTSWIPTSSPDTIRIRIENHHGPRSEASDAAIAALEEMGVRLSLN